MHISTLGFFQTPSSVCSRLCKSKSKFAVCLGKCHIQSSAPLTQMEFKASDRELLRYTKPEGECFDSEFEFSQLFCL